PGAATRDRNLSRPGLHRPGPRGLLRQRCWTGPQRDQHHARLHPDQHVPADVPGRWGELRRPADHPRLRGASPLEGPFTTTETPATVIVAGVVVCGAALD